MSHEDLSQMKEFGSDSGSELATQPYQREGTPADSHMHTLTTSDSGRYKCPHPACDKSFTRQEHLSRHKLNHWPKEIFRCSFVYPNTGLACNKTFVRKDLLARHFKRHSTTGGRLHHNATAGGNDFVSRSHSAVSSITSPPKSGAAGSVPPNLLPQQPLGSLVGLTDPGYQSPVVNDNGMASVEPTQNPYSGSFQLNNRQLGANNQDFNATSNDPRVKNGGGQNINQFFNWLFEHGNSSNAQSSTASGDHASSTAKNSVSASPLPQMVSGLLPQQPSQTATPNISSATQDFSPNVYPMYGFTRAASPPIQTAPQAQNVSPQSRQEPNSQMNVQLQEPIATSASVTKMQDLFSIDFLSSDPLQTFMQELSDPTLNSQDNTNFLNKENVSSASVSPAHSDPVTRTMPRFNDSRRASVKDNLMVQKSNIFELQRQNSYEKKAASAKSPNYKQKVLSSMKMVPSFFHSDPKTKYNISKGKCNEIYEIIPELRAVPIEDLKKSLRSFWLNFHTQYGLLHKPSFNIDEQPPILVLALIMAGASFLGSTYRETISDIICAPLRWIIFSNDDFQPPSKTYIIQSLLLLEGYEKTSTNRYLHERSYLHHGTTIQLLRRTPSLGGHPLILKSEEEPNGLQDPQEVYRRWIDFEMLKRVAFYAFYMDTTHAVVFGYLNLFINCNQIQLTLPCTDLVWESYDLSYETLLEYGFGKERKTFLCTLKQLIGEIIETLQNINNPQSKNKCQELKSWNMKSVFGKKILLAGIISTMFQCQESNEGDLFATTIKCNLGMDDKVVSWQDIFSFAIDYWLYQIQGSCTEAKDCFINPVYPADTTGGRDRNNEALLEDDEENGKIDDVDLLSTGNQFSCKIPEYHMAQVILRIFHYDYYIYSGAPWRMNVKSGNEEYDLVSKRIFQFASDPKTGGVALVYAYEFMFQMFIDKESSKVISDRYDVNSDFCITRPNTLALLALLIWSYNFALYGPEAKMWDNTELDRAANELSFQVPTKDSASTIRLSNKELKESYTPIETFEVYLARMYRLLNVENSSGVLSYHKAIQVKANILKHITGTNHLCGMMKFMKELFENSYWDLGREFAKLFDNCLERCLGKLTPTCESMYKV